MGNNLFFNKGEFGFKTFPSFLILFRTWDFWKYLDGTSSFTEIYKNSSETVEKSDFPSSSTGNRPRRQPGPRERGREGPVRAETRRALAGDPGREDPHNRGTAAAGLRKKAGRNKPRSLP